ncbi:hypothetical protein EDC04DRAFT_2635249, partial [Pisolithus marmoratus]
FLVLTVDSFAFILPPLGVFLERGCGADLVSNQYLLDYPWLDTGNYTWLVPVING